MTVQSGSTQSASADFGANLERLRSITGIKWTRYDDDVIPVWVADMDFSACPAAVDAAQAIVDSGDFGYQFGIVPEAVEAWVEWYDKANGLRFEIDEVVAFCDVINAIEVVLDQVAVPGDGIVLFTPIYPPFIQTASSAGRRLIDCPLSPDGWRLDADVLESVIDADTKVILMCNPHNPTGRMFDREELEIVAAAAARHDLLIVADEIWSDLLHPGKSHIPMASIDGAIDRTVTISSASKPFNLASLRFAVAHIGPTDVRERIKAAPHGLYGSINVFGATGAKECWSRGGDWLGEITAHLTSQRDHLAERLAAELPDVGFQLPEATYLAWLDLRSYGLEDEPAKILLNQARVAAGPGPDFGPSGVGWVRLNLATSREILDEVLDRMVAVLAS